MALYLTEEEVARLLPMREALRLVEQSFLAQHRGQAVNHSRRRILLPSASLHYMAAALPEQNLLGMKIYTTSKEDFRFLVVLYDATNGALSALIEADQLGRIRTGAASGVATRYLARKEASRVGVIGSGRQAATQLEAVAAVRNLDSIAVFSPHPEHRRNFCRTLSARLGLEVREVTSAEAAVRGADIVITATTARAPVVEGEWLTAGVHVNAIGANAPQRRELDAEAIRRADLMAVDSLEQAREESGDLRIGLAELGRDWEGIIELCQVIGGQHPGRKNPQEITLFKSNGIALWDIVVAGYLVEEARRQGVGREWPA